ncbi:unnamed protein product [Arabis nemorensis]|uniref:Uncharacterized protein n=1 Tax=Arabis nemorensis TaxID=586526 RepID=A0A565BTQ5_9BRAS|nr:unnamed protein product [Arabis nemorensis]
MKPVREEGDTSRAEQQTEEGYTLVRHGGHRSESQRIRPVLGDRREKGNLDLESPEIRKENKENHNLPNHNHQGKRVSHEARITFGASMKQNLKGVQLGNKVSGRAQDKSKSTLFKKGKPTRGLVFSPRQEEIALSSSGKRMRMEKETMGRADMGLSQHVRGTEAEDVSVSVGDKMEVVAQLGWVRS